MLKNPPPTPKLGGRYPTPWPVPIAFGRRLRQLIPSAGKAHAPTTSPLSHTIWMPATTIGAENPSSTTVRWRRRLTAAPAKASAAPVPANTPARRHWTSFSRGSTAPRRNFDHDQRGGIGRSQRHRCSVDERRRCQNRPTTSSSPGSRPIKQTPGPLRRRSSVRRTGWGCRFGPRWAVRRRPRVHAAGEVGRGPSMTAQQAGCHRRAVTPFAIIPTGSNNV